MPGQIRSLLLAAGCIGFGASAAAQYQAAPVVVTATRLAQSADETLTAVTVIDRMAIERAQARDVPELLSGVAGVDVVRTGGPGTLSSVFLRGGDSNHVLVLVDGTPVNRASDGSFSWEFLPLEQVERIEIVRGPRSSLYGSNAIGGVIQIFTRQGTPEVRPWASAGTGSHAERRASGGVSGSAGALRYSAGVHALATEGLNACDALAACFVTEPDHDGYRNTGASARVGLGEGPLTLDLHGVYATGQAEFDGSFFGNESDFSQHSAGADLGYAPTARWRLRLSAGQAREDQTFRNGIVRGFADSQRDSASLQNDLVLGTDTTLTVGGDWYEESLHSPSAFTQTERWNRAGFAQVETLLQEFQLIGAARYDDNEQFGGHATGSLAVGRGLGGGVRGHASYASAFSAPTLQDLYFPSDECFASNPDLDPERSRTAELGLSGARGGGRWRVSAFRTRVRGLVTLVGTGELVCFGFERLTVENVARAQIRGLEAEYTAEFGPWSFGLDATLLDAEDRDTGNVLPRRAERSARAHLDRRFARWRVGLTVLAQGRRYDDAANAVRLPGYGRLDLRAEYTLAPAWTLAMRVENLLGKDYRLVRGFRTEDEPAVFLGVHYRPGP
jgi:vitamin B12 transporter